MKTSYKPISPQGAFLDGKDATSLQKYAISKEKMANKNLEKAQSAIEKERAKNDIL